MNKKGFSVVTKAILYLIIFVVLVTIMNQLLNIRFLGALTDQVGKFLGMAREDVYVSPENLGAFDSLVNAFEYGIRTDEVDCLIEYISPYDLGRHSAGHSFVMYDAGEGRVRYILVDNTLANKIGDDLEKLKDYHADGYLDIGYPLFYLDGNYLIERFRNENLILPINSYVYPSSMITISGRIHNSGAVGSRVEGFLGSEGTFRDCEPNWAYLHEFYNLHVLSFSANDLCIPPSQEGYGVYLYKTRDGAISFIPAFENEHGRGLRTITEGVAVSPISPFIGLPTVGVGIYQTMTGAYIDETSFRLSNFKDLKENRIEKFPRLLTCKEKEELEEAQKTAKLVLMEYYFVNGFDENTFDILLDFKVDVNLKSNPVFENIENCTSLFLKEEILIPGGISIEKQEVIYNVIRLSLKKDGEIEGDLVFPYHLNFKYVKGLDVDLHDDQCYDIDLAIYSRDKGYLVIDLESKNIELKDDYSLEINLEEEYGGESDE